jgi:hypothetical protein
MTRNGSAELIGASRQFLALTQEIDRVARSDAKVLITGESGVGKELVARAVHTRSTRAHRVFVPVNCAGLPETLLESELFGHVKGSFTGAYRDKPGKLEIADSGTVFLDEIGEMTLRMQGLLLRFLETGELQKVGSDASGGRVNVRVVAATNRDLRELIGLGQFREDLFYRLNVIHLVVPPLRERKEDIPAMISHSLKSFSTRGDYTVRLIDADALAALSDTSAGRATRARERHRAARRHLPQGKKRRSTIRRTRSAAATRARSGRAGRTASARLPTISTSASSRIESFWTAVYPLLYMQGEITRSNVRDLVGKGLQEARATTRSSRNWFNLNRATTGSSSTAEARMSASFREYREATRSRRHEDTHVRDRLVAASRWLSPA